MNFLIFGPTQNFFSCDHARIFIIMKPFRLSNGSWCLPNQMLTPLCVPTAFPFVYITAWPSLLLSCISVLGRMLMNLGQRDEPCFGFSVLFFLFGCVFR